jgi:tripartite-type tricarboxylate transporter receptor subunit TctC
MRIAILALLAAVALSQSTPAHAQEDWPARPIRIVVPGGPGGGFDTSARIIADKLGPALGGTVIVENRPGAGTLIGTDAVLKSPADGYSLLLGGLSNIALNVGLYPNLSYDPLKDFVPAGLAVSWSFTLVSRNDLPQKTLPEIVEFARANPDKLTYGSTGNGTGQHIAMAVTANLANVKLQHVPYRSAAAAYQDILGSRVDLMFDNTSTAMALVKSGKIHPVAVSSIVRQPVHPDVPTVTETGAARLDMETWFGIFVRAETPPAIVEKLRAAMRKVTADPAVIATFEKTGGRTMHLTAEETETLVRNDVQRWKKLLSDAGIRGD